MVVASQFDFVDEENAVAEYSVLLRHPRVKAEKRNALLAQLADWMKLPRETFWSKQKALVAAKNEINNTQRRLLNTAGDVAPRTINEATLLLSSPQHSLTLSSHLLGNSDLQLVHDSKNPTQTQKRAKKSETDSQLVGPSTNLSAASVAPSASRSSLATKGRENKVDGKIDRKTHKAREERYARMDRRKFWHLQAGGCVEEILMKFNLTNEATVNTLSFVIDLGCSTTKYLFPKDQWEEVVSCRSFALTTIPEETEKYILRLAHRLQMHRSMTDVIIPSEDVFSCELVLDSFRSWARLYSRNPSPFSIAQLGEVFWGRRSWPLIMELLDDIDDVFMIDGEKCGIDSTRCKNSGRSLNNDRTLKRKRMGKKMDLVARDVTSLFDWMIMKRQMSFDPQSSKFLRELGVDLLRETSTIAKNRIQEKDDARFNARSRFFALYGGDRGYQSFELRPGLSNYVLLMKEHGCFRLPPTTADVRPIVRGIVHLLQIRMCMKETIQAYRELSLPLHDELDICSSTDDYDFGQDRSWMYHDDPIINTAVHVASSPLGWLHSTSSTDSDHEESE